MARFLGFLCILAIWLKVPQKIFQNNENAKAKTYQYHNFNTVQDYPNTYSNPYRYSTESFHHQRSLDIQRSISETQKKLNRDWAKSFNTSSY